MTSLENQELEVERANDRFYRAFESLDISRMEETWAKDRPTTCIHPGWGLRSGWPAVRDSWVLIFNHTAGIRFEVTDVDTVIAGEWARVTCREHISTTVDGEAQTILVLATNLFWKDAAGWKLFHHHGSPMFGPPG